MTFRTGIDKVQFWKVKMKIFFTLFGLFCVMASVIMIKLTRDGVSIRSAPIISPSPQGAEYKNVAVSVVNRLFPDFQTAKYVLIGFPADLKAANQIVNDLKLDYEKNFRQIVTMLSDDGKLSAEQLTNCQRPCWILTSETRANELAPENDIPPKLTQITQNKHFHVTLIPFQNIPENSEACIAEKRLSLACLIPLSIHEVRKKFKDPNEMYFFMRKYQDRDYFLFIQTK